MGFDVQTRMEVGVDRGATSLSHDIAEALVANDGRLHLTGRGHATASDALHALRLASEGAPLLVRDPNGSVQGVERTTQLGPVVSSRRKNTSRRWHLLVQALPADFSIELHDVGGTAPLPPAAATVCMSDVVSVDHDGDGAIYLFHPRLRLAIDGPTPAT